ncbi:MAG: T9SS type A sorting domain-containing protein [Bacteroidetes bacterium]|nr:T9SS type A sorting domain-containing protein [Bacteroidota bacterium]
MKSFIFLFSLVFFFCSENLNAQNQLQTWTGIIDTSFNNPGNWISSGSVQTPDCSIDILIVPATNQPVISGNQSVGSIDIQAGATLKIKSNASVYTCGNIANNGSIIAENSSTIILQDTSTQHLSGNLIGTNSLYQLIVSKSNGSIEADTNIEIRNDLSLSNPTSVFRLNSNSLYLGGSLLNNIGPSNFIASNTGHVHFNGNTNQVIFSFFNENVLIDTVSIEKPNGDVILSTHAGNLVVGKKLNLVSGKIFTGIQEVEMLNVDTAAVSNGNLFSYVLGNLRRQIDYSLTLQLPATYFFPVGGTFYELLEIRLKSILHPHTLVVRFEGSPVLPGLSPSANNCDNTYDLVNHLDHGYWRILKDSNPTGIFEIGLHNIGYTNNAGAYWTVVEQDTNNFPPGVYDWQLNGVCVVGSTNMLTLRDSMTVFNKYYAVAQGVIPYTGLSDLGTNSCVRCGIFPNPVPRDRVATLRLFSNHQQTVHLEIFDPQGKLVDKHPIALNSGENEIPLNVHGFSPGVYFIKTKSASENFPVMRLEME